MLMKRKHNFKTIFSISILLVSFLFSTIGNAQENFSKEKVYVKIEIKGMACPFCAYGMEKELKKVAGIYNVVIELESGLALISTPKNQKPEEEDLKKIITEAGFTVGNIEYSNVPFVIAENKE